MDSTTTFIIVAICAWVMQIGLGFIQLRAFNRTLQTMAGQGTVKIGRTEGRWKPRTVVVLAEDSDNIIVDARVMKGLSVFSRPKVLPVIIGKRFPFDSSVDESLNIHIREAIAIAFSK